MKIVQFPDLMLNTKTNPVLFIDQSITDLSQEMHKATMKAKGYGLAANQVGYSLNMFVFDTGWEGFSTAINSEILEFSDETCIFTEGCLSLKNKFFQIRRPASILFRFMTEEEVEIEREYSGITARIIQHELDHVNGLTVLDRLNSDDILEL